MSFNVAMDFLTSSLVVISLVLICSLIFLGARKSSKPPPGPYGPPIIGNILHLGPKPHRSLAKLAGKYGSVMRLELGSITTIVISSPETARIVLQKHDSSFWNRFSASSIKSVKHDEFSVGWLPVDEQWRKLRRICREHVFSAPRLDAGRGMRREKLQKLSDYVRECCEAGRAVTIGETAFNASLNLVSSALFSTEFAALGSDSSQEMKEVVWGVMKSFGRPNLVDYFPVLKAADPQGILKETRFYCGKLFAIFDEILDERLKISRGEKQDLLEELVHLNQRDQLSRDHIKHLLLDFFVAGTDSTSGTVEWAMAEMLRRPTTMSKLRTELRNFIEENGEIDESDLARLPYLQALVKETFRLHPAAPFLIPRQAGSDVEINGYTVPKNSQVLVNAWAIGRDPNIWSNADEFVPERFLNENKNVDFKGQDFELIPFGAGRRVCPGVPLASRMVQQMLVTLVGDFEWKLLEGTKMDMDEKFGIILQKAIPLRAIPTKL